MPSPLKTCVKRLFRFCGFDVKRLPPYQPYEWLRQFDIRTVLDIGANVGQFAEMIHAILPGATIYSFEPLSGCYEQLKRNMARISGSTAFNFALGDANGKAQIYHNDFTPSSSLLPMEELHVRAFPFTRHATPEEIEIRRLDDVVGELDIADNVLVKIDVQGMEDKVLLGGESVLARTSILIVETSFKSLYKGQALFDQIYRLVRERGFTFMGSEHNIRNPMDGRVLQSDSVFIRQNKAHSFLHMQAASQEMQV